MSNSELISKLARLVSEAQNLETIELDRMSSIEIVTILNQQDKLVPEAIEKISKKIAEAVDAIVMAMTNGGRLVYIGAGTSGRLGVLDAVECVPTFGVPEGLVVGLLAGGESAMFKAKEGVEDDKTCGVEDLKKIELNPQDIVVGIAASGRTPYVIGALEYANSIGVKTIALSCNPDAEIGKISNIELLPIVGPEPLAGSTRMKSGTAQKMVLNILSTASMIQMGKVYGNLMVDVKATNKKLYARGVRMVMDVTGVDEQTAESTLLLANLRVKLAILMLLADIDRVDAEDLLLKSNGFLRRALKKGRPT